MSNSLVKEIIAAAGQPVAGHTLTVEEMRRAVEEGRVLHISYWSTFGEGEALFEFATDFGLVYEGKVHPTYIVFPRPIPPELRRTSGLEWGSIGEVYAEFGIDPGP